MTRALPMHVEIELTNHCNLACVMCPHRKMKRKKGYMSWDTLHRIIEQAAPSARTCYMHQIGEPLLHPDLVPMINAVQAAGVKTSISTNAVLLENELAVAILHSDLAELSLSLDGMTKETYDQLRVGGDFERVVLNIDNFLNARRARTTGPTVIMQLIKMKQNVREAEAFRDKYYNMVRGFGSVLTKCFSTFAGGVEDLHPDGTPPRRFSCPKTYTSITFHWNGDAVICCRDYEGVSVVGNINDTDLMDIWNSEKYLAYRRQFKKQDWTDNPMCEKC